MNIVVLTPVRLLGDGLAASFGNRPQFTSVEVVNDLASLRHTLQARPIHVALIDVTQGIDLIDVRSIATQWPQIPLVALGLNEVRQQVIQCGRAGFSGYIAREATIDGVCQMLSDIVQGKLICPPEISGGLLRALFRDYASSNSRADPKLTHRECQVLERIGRGLSNKEIGKELRLSVATVKHHVHHLLSKLGLSRRADAMRQVRDTPWISHITPMGNSVSPNHGEIEIGGEG